MGAIEEAKGKAKEAAGSLTGSDDLRREGQAQQNKADEEEKAERARLEAEKHEHKAEGHEGVERKHQGT
ncbi:CsbD family protein [Pseudonocardia spinosispora]|uniref:CsbD family protein n=1 Tax=Pseudonocardia spinosispora TaxID=103441 RepID=UPI0003FBDDF1|nr:CsbD family protein [Pseudonocardia spinosispora]